MKTGILNKQLPDYVTAIDQLYAGKLVSFYSEIERLAGVVWPEMKLCPVCIYRQGGPAFLYKHPNPPETFTSVGDGIWLGQQADLQLFGATPFDINGVLTAINHYDRKDQPLECFHAELFHEMHHVYQSNNMSPPRWDDVALVITYPELVENDALKIYENRILAQLVLFDEPQIFQELLNNLYTCRLKRQTIIGDAHLDMEKRVESVEGPATYCQYKYLESRDKTGWDKTLFQTARQQEFFWLLCQPEYGRYHLRHRLLMTGLAQCLILSRQGIPNWQKEYFDGSLLLNDFFFTKLPASQAPIPENEDLKAAALFFLNQTQKDRSQRLIKFEHQEGIRVKAQFKTLPECQGIDPMNAEAMDAGVVMHNTMLKLGWGENAMSFLTGGVLTNIRSSVWEIESLEFFLEDREQLKIEGGMIVMNSEGRQLRWKGRIVSDSEKEISMELE